MGIAKRNSLGVLFYELLTGLCLFQADTKKRLLEKIRNFSVRPPRHGDNAIPRELERICLKALSRRPSDRYTTAKDFAADLRHFLAEAPPEKLPENKNSFHAGLPPEKQRFAWLGELEALLAGEEPAAGRTAEAVGAAYYQGSILDCQGRLLLATRRDGPCGAEIHISLLTSDLQVSDTWQLQCRHPFAEFGQEDPRLFLYRGQLHVSFHGLSYSDAGAWRTTMMLARLSADGRRAEDVWQPFYDQAQHWEKNWAFFEADDGSLHCVYSIEPHVVLRVEGEHAHEVARTEAGLCWDYGLLRGGAPPVRVGDEYYHWFHGACLEPFRYHTLGVYTFSAHSPFRVTRYSPQPLLEPEVHPWEKPNVQPCGAILRAGRWLVSYGHNDRRSRIAEFEFEAVERALRPT